MTDPATTEIVVDLPAPAVPLGASNGCKVHKLRSPRWSGSYNERDDQAVIAHMDAIEQQDGQPEIVERPTRQGSSCCCVRAIMRRLTVLLLVLRLSIAGSSGSKLRAYCRVTTPTSICSTMRRSNGSV